MMEVVGYGRLSLRGLTKLQRSLLRSMELIEGRRRSDVRWNADMEFMVDSNETTNFLLVLQSDCARV